MNRGPYCRSRDLRLIVGGLVGAVLVILICLI